MPIIANSPDQSVAVGPAGRRWFLRLGGAGALGAVAAACGGAASTTAKVKIKAQQTGSAPTTNDNIPPNTLPPQPPTKTEQEADLANLRTATSYEYAINSAYQAINSQVTVSGGVEFNAIRPVMISHHQAAIVKLQDATRSYLADAQQGPNASDFAGLKADDIVYTPGKLKDEQGQPDDKGNGWTWTNIIVPALKAIATNDDVIKFARELEDAAVATHAVATGVYSTKGLRHLVMTIGAVEARHSAKLGLLVSGAKPADGAPNAIFFTRDALGTNSLLTFNGKAASSAAG